jgi:simple sugar transport system permease protein
MVWLRPNLFISSRSFTSMGYQLPDLGFYSIAMMMVLLTGGIDLSVVGTGNLACIMAALIMRAGPAEGLTGYSLAFNIALGVAAALATGFACGLFNGFIVANLGIAPVLVTMATYSIYTGIGIIITEGKAVSKVAPQFLYLGNNTFMYIPIPLWGLIIALRVTASVLNKTKYGFEAKMVGSNATASHYTGMNNRMILIKTYIYSGLISAVCGLQILSRTDTAKADYAFTYTLQAILCAVLGATSPAGGFAKVACLTFSLISLQFLSSGFNMLRLGGYFREFAWGFLLLLVLSINYLAEERRRKKSIASVHQSSLS